MAWCLTPSAQAIINQIPAPGSPRPPPHPAARSWCWSPMVALAPRPRMVSTGSKAICNKGGLNRIFWRRAALKKAFPILTYTKSMLRYGKAFLPCQPPMSAVSVRLLELAHANQGMGCMRSSLNARIAQLVERRICNAKVGGSTPSLGTISLPSYEHLSCVGARGSTPSVGTISKKVEGSPADYASLLRRPVHVHLPWLPARPVASTLALKHRSRPSLGTNSKLIFSAIR